MVTAELALAVPTLVAVVVVACTALSVVSAQQRCLDAAAVAARLAARGETPAATAAAARAAAPGSSTVHVVRHDGLVVADVTAVVRPPGAARLLPGFVVHERVVAADEEMPDASG